MVSYCTPGRRTKAKSPHPKVKAGCNPKRVPDPVSAAVGSGWITARKNMKKLADLGTGAIIITR